MGMHGGHCFVSSYSYILFPPDLWTCLQFLSCWLKRGHQANLPEDAKRIAKKELKPLPQLQRCIWCGWKWRISCFYPAHPFSCSLGAVDCCSLDLPRRLKSLQAHHPEYTSTHSQDLESRHLVDSFWGDAKGLDRDEWGFFLTSFWGFNKSQQFQHSNHLKPKLLFWQEATATLWFISDLFYLVWTFPQKSSIHSARLLGAPCELALEQPDEGAWCLYGPLQFL